jgi:hypothetical protein
MRYRYANYFLALAALTVGWAGSQTALAQCPTEPRLENFTGAGTTSCPCFDPGEQAGAIFTLPAGDFPIEILRVGVGWGSQFGGAPDQLEQAIHIYQGGLPNPGAPVFSLVGPQLTDGVINEFDLEPLPGQIIIDSAPFTVTLEFFNQNAGDPFAPTVVHDGNGCQPGKNVVFAVPGVWNDACLLGVSGNWIFYVFYRKTSCGAPGSVPDGHLVSGTPMRMAKASGGQLTLTWSPSCSTADTDYLVYEGFAGAYYSHFSKLCTTGGATSATLTPGSFDRYYLVVPTDETDEGSYGRDSNSAERPRGGAACQSQQTVTCP